MNGNIITFSSSTHQSHWLAIVIGFRIIIIIIIIFGISNTQSHISIDCCWVFFLFKNETLIRNHGGLVAHLWSLWKSHLLRYIFDIEWHKEKYFWNILIFSGLKKKNRPRCSAAVSHLDKPFFPRWPPLYATYEWLWPHRTPRHLKRAHQNATSASPIVPHISATHDFMNVSAVHVFARICTYLHVFTCLYCAMSRHDVAVFVTISSLLRHLERSLKEAINTWGRGFTTWELLEQGVNCQHGHTKLCIPTYQHT